MDHPTTTLQPPLLTDAGEVIPLDHEPAFCLPVTAGEADLDAQGHVNNAVYVRWMDRAAYAHSAALGFDWDRYQSLGASFVVRRHEIDYLSPAFAGDRLCMVTWPSEMAGVRAGRRHQIVRLSDGATLARAHTHWVFVDHQTARPRRIPADLLAIFHAAAGR